MDAMDIEGVSVYRGGRYLNVTVRFSEGWFDETFPLAYGRRCLIWYRGSNGGYIHPDEVASGWIDNGITYFEVIDLGTVGDDIDFSVFEIKSRIDFDVIIDLIGKIKEERSISWVADVFVFEFP